MGWGVTTELGKQLDEALRSQGGFLPGSDLKSLLLKVSYVLSKLGLI